MNKLLILILIIVLLAGGVYLFKKQSTKPASETQMQMTPSTTSQQPTVTETTTSDMVTIQNFAFSPATLTVKVGTTVTWENKDTSPHSATADDGSFDTGLINKGESKTVTLNKAGTFTYHCSVHPNMKATVIVQ